MPKLAPLNFREIRHRVSPQLILSYLGYPVLVWSRGEGRSGCPVHRSTAPRSRVMASNGQVCYCHKCHFRGDAIELVKTVRQLSTLEAAYEVCRIAALPTSLFRI